MWHDPLMCAKYATADGITVLEKNDEPFLPPIMDPRPKIVYPHTMAPVIVRAAPAKFEVRSMNYSLVPSWSKVRKPKFVTYNARIEEVLQRPSWKEPFQSRHCLVPMQQFFESVYEGPFAGHNISISQKGQGVLTAAGIWDAWRDSVTGEWLESFAILTTEPPAQVLEAGHDRCPIFLKTDACAEWALADKSADSWIGFIKQSIQPVEFEFTQGERLKGYTGQMSLFGDE